MANKILWSSTPLSFSSTINNENNILNITINGSLIELTIEPSDYMTKIITHESRLVDEINSLLELENLSIKCKLGVFADGNIKSGYIVFEIDENDSVSISGTITDLVGVVEESIVEMPEEPVEETPEEGSSDIVEEV